MKYFRCAWPLSLSSRITPKKRVSLTLGMGKSFFRTSGSRTWPDLLLVKTISWDLVGDSTRFLLSRKAKTYSKASWMSSCADAKLEEDTESIMSLAYWVMKTCSSKHLLMFLRWRLNNKGLKEDPCGVSLCDKKGLVSLPLLTTKIFRSVIRFSMNLCMNLRIPMLSRSVARIDGMTLSNAPWISRKTPPTNSQPSGVNKAYECGQVVHTCPTCSETGLEVEYGSTHLLSTYHLSLKYMVFSRSLKTQDNNEIGLTLFPPDLGMNMIKTLSHDSGKHPSKKRL